MESFVEYVEQAVDDGYTITESGREEVLRLIAVLGDGGSLDDFHMGAGPAKALLAALFLELASG